MNDGEQLRRKREVKLLGIAVWCSVILNIGCFSAAQDLAALEDEVEEFQAAAQEIYRFDEEAMEAIREAYCGLLDPNSQAYNRDFAAEIGLNYQQQQEDQWEEVMDQVGPLIEALETLQENLGQENPEKAERAEALLESVVKEASTLQDLGEGIVLRGANHPFVQFAINYGIQKHKDLCSLGESPKVCDKTWPTLGDRRPDLVYVDSSGLWILEFKPNNDRAISEGEKQVRDYVDGVEAYFQNFFPEGRAGGYKSIPDSDHGGEEMVKKLLATDEVWTSNGDAVEASWKVVTYDRCQEP